MKKVLYIHHSPTFGGASRSLLETIKAFPDDTVEPYFICPQGSVANEFSKVSDNVLTTLGISIFDHTHFSSYKGKRWLILIREFLFLWFNFYVMLKAKILWRKNNFAVVHVNEIGLIPSIYLAKKLYSCPVICHCRSIQNKNEKLLRTKFMTWFLNKYVNTVIAIDNDCANSLRLNINVDVIHNGLNINSSNNHDYVLPKHDFKVCFVGNMLESKGIVEFIDCARIAKEFKEERIKFVVIAPKYSGSMSFVEKLFDFLGFRRLTSKFVDEFIQKYELDNVILTGFQRDISPYLKQINLICFPSHLDAVGRPVFEAAYFGVPSIVAVSKPTSDTFIPDETGIQIKPNSSEEILRAILKFKSDEQFYEKCSMNSLKLSREFYNIKLNAKKLLTHYM